MLIWVSFNAAFRAQLFMHERKERKIKMKNLLNLLLKSHMDMMKREKTLLRDLLPSLLHRELGQKLYCTDIDCIEYRFINGKRKAVAIIDYKNPVNSSKLDTTGETVLFQSDLADQLNIPFFLAYTFLEEEYYPTNMMYLLPINEIAKKMFETWNIETPGKWLGIRNYSKFLCSMHEIDDDEEAQNELSNLYIEYPLPGAKK